MRENNVDQSSIGAKQPQFPLFKVLLCWLLFICLSAGFNVLQLFLHALYAEPIHVSVGGIDPTKKADVNVTLVMLASKSGTGQLPELPALRESEKFSWFWYSFWVDSIRLHATTEALLQVKSLTVSIGSDTRTFTSDEIKTWKKDKSEAWALPEIPVDDLVSMTVPLSKHGPALNMPDVMVLLGHAVVPGFLIATTSALLLFYVFRARTKLLIRLRKILGEDSDQKSFLSASGTPHAVWDNLFIVAGFAAIIAGFAILNSHGRYPFLQDDNYCQFLPVVMRSAETLCTGRMPVWNPYQLLGAPTTTVGTYALTYAPTYVSYFLAHWLGNDLETFDFFCVAHLCVAYFVTVWTLRRLNISASLATSGALCWVLSGWFLVGGTSQANFVPYAVFLPLLIDCLNTLFKRGGSLGWCFWTGTLIGVLFHAGHAELWVYTMMFLALAVAIMMVSRNLDLKRICYFASAVSLGIAIAAPLLVLQKMETTDISRLGGSSWSVDLLPLLLPLGPLGYSGFALGSVDYKYGTELYYAGTIFTAVGILAFAFWLALLVFERRGMVRSVIRNNIWLIVGGVAFILCLGAPGVIWSCLSYLPIFDKFRWSIKYIPFVQIFFVFSGALILERCASERVKALVFVSVFVLMLFHTSLCRSTFYTFLDRDYAPISPKIESAVYNGKRVYTAAPFRIPVNNVVQSLILNFPTVYSIISASGYDTFVSTKPAYERFVTRLYLAGADAAKHYGLNTLIVNDCVEHPISSGNPAEQIIEVVTGLTQKSVLNLESAGKLIDHSFGRRVYQLPTADAIVFADDKPQDTLPYRLSQTGVAVDTSTLAAGQTVIVNFICWPWMRASADGRPIEVKPDKWDRIEITLPAATRTLTVEYQPPWHMSFAVAIGLFLFSSGLFAFANSLKEKSDIDRHRETSTSPNERK
ncbi:MAG TPA: hypothetical protein V6C86_21735 [Oculatellaceae cyanobacterium]